MTIAKATDKTRRVNVVMLESVQEIAAKVMAARLKGDNFSELVRDLIIEEYKRPEAVSKAETAWLNRAFREALAETAKLKEENDKLKAKIQDRRQLGRAAMDMTAEYRRLFEEANGRLEEGRRVEDTIKSGRWANAASR